MHIVTVKYNGKLNLIETVKYNTTPGTLKSDRQTLKEIIERRKNAQRNARLVQILTK